jgi:carbon storage regulator CsrA
MLILSRKNGEKIVITLPPSTTPQRVEILVHEARMRQVRLGVEAEPSVIIHREEVQRLVDAHGPRREGIET